MLHSIVRTWLLAALACTSGAALALDPADGAQTAEGLERARVQAADKLAAARASYPEYFRRAYARYPALPRGVLEAIAHTQTGWVHVAPDPGEPARHRHMPASYGVMGLYRGEGFDDQVRDGARLLGVGEQLVVADPETNILAGAALLDRALKQQAASAGATKAGGIDATAGALVRYAGYGLADGRIQSHARNSFAYDVLQVVSNGVNANGIRIDARPVSFERAFSAGQLALLRAPAVTAILAQDRVVAETAPPATATARAAASPDAGIAAVDFGEAIWNPASPSNYSTASNAMSAVIMHTMEGSYAGAISWFRNPSAQVSAHYLIRKSDGQITQMVRESHQAWHAAYHNGYTIGIEHDGRAADPNNWSSAMVNASARLVRSLCIRRGVDCRSAWQGPGYDHWRVVPDSVRIKGHGMLTNNQNRYDPGKYFPWAGFYGLINNGAPPPPPPPPVAAPKYWVDTYANAPGYGSPTGTAQTGTLYAGTNYVHCKSWGREIRNGAAFNRWWLKTDLDVGAANQWVSAYYLSRWGNDEARDNDGFDLPRCEVLPYGKIAEKYYAMGGVRSLLGVPKLAEMAAQAGGRFQEFDKGIILWHARTGAHAVHGRILAHFWATQAETRWGFPLMDELAAARSPVSGQTGRFQYFERGLFLWTAATDAHVLHGAILDHFEATGREAQYGYPLADEEAHGGNGRKQVFERATLYWTPESGVTAR